MLLITASDLKAFKSKAAIKNPGRPRNETISQPPERDGSATVLCIAIILPSAL